VITGKKKEIHRHPLVFFIIGREKRKEKEKRGKAHPIARNLLSVAPEKSNGEKRGKKK